MTDKDSNDMTASELLRKAADQDAACHSTGIDELAYLMGINDGTCYSVRFEALADKIDVELAQARELSLRRGAELWAKANGWPDFRDGEDFGAWLERCALKLPCDKDGEPWSIGDRVMPGNRSESTVTGYDFDGNEWFLKYRWCGIDSYANEFATFCKRPAPEALGADGLPIKEGETVWSIHGIHEGIVKALNVNMAHVEWSDGRWSPSILCKNLTHTPPDTLERLRDDIAEWRADCAKPGSGWDVKTAEWADRIDAIIRRKGGAE